MVVARRCVMIAVVLEGLRRAPQHTKAEVARSDKELSKNKITNM